MKPPKQDADGLVQKALANKILRNLTVGTDTHQCNHSDPIGCNQTRTGALSSTDCILQDGTYIDDWTISLSTGQQITINLTSPTLDTYLFLIDPSDEAVVQDDDSGGNGNSRIIYTAQSSGTYHIVANTFNDDLTFGDYTLAVSCGTCTTTAAATSCNTTANGNLSTSDCTIQNAYFDEWTFSGTNGQQVTINQRSGTFDTYLALINPSGTVVAENDDESDTSTDSVIRHTLTASGTWRILATSFRSLTTGAYTLQIQCTGGGGDGQCTTGGTQLCLNNNRFRITVNWRDFNGNTGSGNAVGLTNDTGYFWFFNAANVELVIKVLDATSVNNRFWVYYGALSNVEYTITVTDTLRGATKTYTNPSGTFASAGDVNAFAP